MLALILIIFFAFLILGCPIAMAMGVSVIPFFVLTPSASGITIAQKMFTACDSFSLMAIPFFMLAGGIMEQTGIIKDMVRWAQCLVGHFRGGLAQTSTISGVILAGVSGSANADAAALGNMLLPAMKAAGYDAGYSVVCLSTAAGLGPIIPPSINMVIFCSIVGLSTGAMFAAGILPGLLLACTYMVYNYLYARKNNMPSGKFCGFKVLLKTTKEAFFALLMPIIIIGGILSGIFTPTEAAAVSVFYGLIVGILVYREISLKKIKDILIDSCSTTATVMFITMGATLFGYVLTRARLDLAIEGFMMNVTGGSSIIFFIIVNIVLLIAGCFLDSTSALYIFTPLFAPVALQLGIDPIHLGAVMIVNLAVGLFTPPVGVNLYVACGIGKIKIEEITKGIVPCLVAELVVLLLVTYIPALSTMLVG